MRRAIAVAMLALASVPVPAQVHGVPPSVTSMGPGVPPSVTSPGPDGISSAPPAVTSMGPLGWQDPRGKFFQGKPFSPHHHPGFKGGFHSGRWHRGGVVVVPWYAPYPLYAYPMESYSDATATAPEVLEQLPVAPPAAVPATMVPPEPPAPPAAPTPPSAPTPELPVQETTILVFRDGHQMEVTNYAIVGQELINLSGKGPRRIPLADLDVPATVRVNDDRGVSFRLPIG